MKNKKNIYILLPVVLLVWGTVIYQFFSLSKNETNTVNKKKHFATESVQYQLRDTSSINVNYRDPFLGKIYEKQNLVRKKIQTHKIIQAPKTIQLPTIVYKGIVSDSKEKTKVFMVIINGNTFLMKKGDKENGVILKDGNRESITVENKETIQNIPIKV